MTSQKLHGGHDAPTFGKACADQALDLLEALLDRAMDGEAFLETRILELVAEAEPLDAQDLLFALQSPGGAVRPILASMESRGLIARRKNPADRRRLELRLTRAGRESLAAAKAGRPDMSLLIETLSPDDLVSLQTMLGKLGAALMAGVSNKNSSERQHSDARKSGGLSQNSVKTAKPALIPAKSRESDREPASLAKKGGEMSLANESSRFIAMRRLIKKPATTPTIF